MLRRLFVVLSSFLAVHGYSEPVTAPEELQTCVVCHGIELAGNQSVDAPNLSVLSAWYLKRQMQNYKQGLRAPHGSKDHVGREMAPLAADFGDDDMAVLEQYLADIPVFNAPVTIRGNASRGASLYISCSICHGADGEGNPTFNAPRLAGQSDWYLVRQLENFQRGIRGNSPEDLYGSQMRLSTSILTDRSAIEDVVAHVNTLKRGDH